MTKPHTNKTDSPPASAPETPTTPEGLENEAEDAGLALSAAEQDQLLYSTKFLLNVMSPRFARVRVAVGFTALEHGEGWNLFRQAAGEDTALAILAAQSENQKGARPALPIEALQSLDAFENKWFPRARRIIERFASADEKLSMLDAFFLNLTQQPLGPGLMFSVPTFIARVRSLEAGTFKSGAATRKVLAERGLTDAVLDAMQLLVDQLRANSAPPEGAGGTEVDARTLADTLRAQREGFAAFRAYWLDWSQTFREELPRREAIVLGVSSPRAKKAKTPDPV